ncbi:hypothetical protein [Escherichia coli]|uniref:TipJ family phage tail tip protein n=1 Tax=Escherichia coli TaxID=562 RepID=UPI00388E86ED
MLGTEVKYDTPITRTITSANIDRLRFTFGVQALVETTQGGPESVGSPPAGSDTITVAG